jgi:hypothetical protein
MGSQRGGSTTLFRGSSVELECEAPEPWGHQPHWAVGEAEVGHCVVVHSCVCSFAEWHVLSTFYISGSFQTGEEGGISVNKTAKFCLSETLCEDIPLCASESVPVCAPGCVCIHAYVCLLRCIPAYVCTCVCVAVCVHTCEYVYLCVYAPGTCAYV